jgi:hypothetical protein
MSLSDERVTEIASSPKGCPLLILSHRRSVPSLTQALCALIDAEQPLISSPTEKSMQPNPRHDSVEQAVFIPISVKEIGWLEPSSGKLP